MQICNYGKSPVINHLHRRGSPCTDLSVASCNSGPSPVLVASLPSWGSFQRGEFSQSPSPMLQPSSVWKASTQSSSHSLGHWWQVQWKRQGWPEPWEGSTQVGGEDWEEHPGSRSHRNKGAKGGRMGEIQNTVDLSAQRTHCGHGWDGAVRMDSEVSPWLHAQWLSP